MTDNMYIKKISKLISEVLEDENNIEVNMETHLIGVVNENDLGLSSIDYVELIVKVEQEFDVIYDFDVQLNTVGDLINYNKSNKEGSMI